MYDISLLGRGHFSSSDRTGLFRVVEKGVDLLLGSCCCDIKFCSSEGNHELCEKYLKDVYNLIIHINKPSDLIANVYDVIQPAKDHIRRNKKHILNNTFARSIYHFGKRYVNNVAYKDISSSDIYHSPVHPIPSSVSDVKTIKKFITMHDIIPLVYDDYVSTQSAVHMKNTVRSIDMETYVLCTSNHTKSDLLNYSNIIDQDKVKVIHLAADDKFYQCKDHDRIANMYKKYCIPFGKKYLLTLSTFMPRKNFPRTIRCFVQMLRETGIKDLCLVIVGAVSWDYEEMLFEIEQAKEFRKNIIITGYVPDEDLAPLYSGATAFLYLSMYEGFGLPPLEAMQCGTAVITSNTSSLPEVVGDAGIMVDPLDEEAICSAMHEVYNSSSLRERLEKLSFARAKQFSWDKYGNEMIAVYSSSLS